MTDTVIDLEVYKALAEIVGKDFIDEMVETFLEEGAQFVVDLDKSFADGDIDLFRRAAHSMKSNAATFGAIKLSNISQELENMARQGQLDGVNEKLEPISAVFSNTRQALKELKNV
jgi:HPt (histidine-containing phosphotransfer) domain-containing protein